MVKRIVWTKKADNEWKSILAFWYEHTGNKKYSKKLNTKLKLTLQNIKSNNYIGKKTSKDDIRVVICLYFVTSESPERDSDE